VEHHIKSCHDCQVRGLKRLEKPLTVSLPSVIFQKMNVDVMYMPAAAGYHAIVVAKDDLTGTTEARALRNVTAQALANFFWAQIYCRYGVPYQVTTDNGSEMKEAFADLMIRLGVPQVKISPYNKHANGQVERGNYVLRESLIKFCGDSIEKWPLKLQQAVFANNVTASSVTGYSPYQLLHATEPLMPFDLFEATFLVEGFYSGMTTSELLAKRIQQVDKHPEDIAKAAEVLKQSRFQSKTHFERRFRKRLMKGSYKRGELVLVRNARRDQEIGGKERVRYFGPYKVDALTYGGAYRLKELDGTKFDMPVAAYRILPYISRNHWFMSTGWLGKDEA
jgi:hypothetical protein